MSDGKETTSPTTPLLSVAWRVLGALSAILVLGLAVGFLLPGTWWVQREIDVEAPADSVFAVLDDLSRWQSWTPWSDVDVTLSGPGSGVGATMNWDDPFAGRGVFRLTGSQRPRQVAYRVDVEGGPSMEGIFTLSPIGAGTRVVWREEGDFGWNPLMAYAALTMDRVQGDQLTQGLSRLKAVVETGSLPEREPASPSGRGG